MKKISTAFALLSLCLFYSCSKEKKEDKAPESFTVSVTNSTVNSAQLDWTEAKDPEGQAVKYSIQLNGSNKETGLQVRTYQLTGLTKNTTYNGKVVAEDPAGNKTESTFQVITSDSPMPSEFSVQTETITSKTIVVSWTKSELTDNSPVSYDIFVNDQLNGNVSDLKITLASLKPATSYRIKVVAKSPDGKSREKILDATTKANSAPDPITIQFVKNGFNYVTVSGTGIKDQDNDKLTYFYVLNNTEFPIAAGIPNSSSAFTYTNSNIGENRDVTFAIRVKDEFDAVTTSNAISFKTYQQPPSPSVSVWEEPGGDVVIEWINYTQDEFTINASRYFINGSPKNMSPSQIVSTTLPNGHHVIRLTIGKTELPDNTNSSLRVEVNWGLNVLALTSNTVSFMKYVYSPTSAIVASAEINGPAGSYQFFVTYQNGIISQHNDWDIVKLQFDNIILSNFATIIGATPNKGYHTGNVWSAAYEQLKTRSSGFVIIHDQDGYHKHLFDYVIKP